MYNKTELFQQALQLVKDNGDVADPNEGTPSAALCRTWYPMVRKSILAAAPWLSARSAVNLVRSSGPASGFSYRYELPGDLIAPIHLSSWERFHFSPGQFLDTNGAAPTLIYTRDEDDLSRWEVGRYNATLFYMAGMMAPHRTGDMQLADYYIARAKQEVQEAAAEFANQTEEYYDSIPDWVAARGFSSVAASHRYFYPFTSLRAGMSSPSLGVAVAPTPSTPPIVVTPDPGGSGSSVDYVAIYQQAKQ